MAVWRAMSTMVEGKRAAVQAEAKEERVVAKTAVVRTAVIAAAR